MSQHKVAGLCDSESQSKANLITMKCFTFRERKGNLCLVSLNTNNGYALIETSVRNR